MKHKLFKKQIIQQGGSYVVTIPKNVGFALNDVVDVTIEHSQEFEYLSDKIFSRIARQKMEELGTDKLTIEAIDKIEHQDEHKENKNEHKENKATKETEQ